MNVFLLIEMNKEIKLSPHFSLKVAKYVVPIGCHLERSLVISSEVEKSHRTF